MTKKLAIYSRLICVLITAQIANFSIAQTSLELIAPLNIPLILSGNFGEFRGSHFHTGIDLKTQGKEGFPVLAAADGKVKRVKVSPWGYGNALYLEHSDGSQTVYAHLQKFAPEIEAWLLKKQYSGRVFALDLRLDLEFTFASGDTIGISGNSGGSGGPHLHFEIRDKHQHPVNPLHFDLPISDKRPPEIGALTVVPLNRWGVEQQEDAISVSPSDTGRVEPGPIHLGVKAIDRLDGASNVCGVYKIEVYIDGSPHFECTIDTLDFSVNQDMNAHVYYPTWKNGRSNVHRFDVLEGDRLPIYDLAPTKPLNLEHDSILNVQVKCYDAHGNNSSKNYILRGDSDLESPPAPGVMGRKTRTTLPTAAFELVSGNLKLKASNKTFYSKEDVFIQEVDSLELLTGPSTIPLKKPVEISLKTKGDLPEDLWVARSVDDKGRLSGAIKCEMEYDRLIFKTKNLGRYRFERDTIPPRLLPKHSATPVVKSGDLIFHVEDAVSGVEKIEATMDGEWILLRWDPKKKTAIYKSSDSFHEPGSKVRVEVIATDAVGLESKWSGTVQMK